MMMELFINGTGCISPQASFDNSVFLSETLACINNRMTCLDPDYSSLFDNGTLRRMSRVIKFATGAGLIALRDAGIKAPGAISIGTGLGLLENSGNFLKNVIEEDESLISPTSFIQSTHNTIGGVLALMTGCYSHNNSFSQSGISFESALTDACMLMSEGYPDNFLVGGFDELTQYSLAVMARLNILRKEPCRNLELLNKSAHGIIAGEGAAFFVLSKQKSEACYGKLIDHEVFTGSDKTDELKSRVVAFLDRNNFSLSQLDVVITGLCGDTARDFAPNELNNTLFTAQTIVAYKHLCGEYMTASSFAFWLAAKMLKTGDIPASTVVMNRARKPENILIFNQYKGHCSLILFRKC